MRRSELVSLCLVLSAFMFVVVVDAKCRQHFKCMTDEIQANLTAMQTTYSGYVNACISTVHGTNSGSTKKQICKAMGAIKDTCFYDKINASSICGVALLSSCLANGNCDAQTKGQTNRCRNGDKWMCKLLADYNNGTTTLNAWSKSKASSCKTCLSDNNADDTTKWTLFYTTCMSSCGQWKGRGQKYCKKLIQCSSRDTPGSGNKCGLNVLKDISTDMESTGGEVTCDDWSFTQITTTNKKAKVCKCFQKRLGIRPKFRRKNRLANKLRKRGFV